ncbi:MAG: I78 family peptidase inhibitor [Paracoccus sp. (in: a-proteobacteria)]|nr:I78 family peptidase inhibitor [Paracoccus sp. (in: a-proteobacteria)]
MRLIAANLAAATLLVAACIPETAPDDQPIGGGPGRGDVVCRPGIDDAGLIGQRADAVSLPRGISVRVVPEGMMATTDYVETRITLSTDRGGRIIAANCG